MSGLVDSESAVVAVRRLEDGSEAAAPLAQTTIGVLSSAAPWRTFRWHRGQRHYSGTFWSATEDGHVIYESRLELARLLFADFEPSVHRIIAQPFLLSASVNGVLRRHVPDYLLLMDTGPLVVDVKPRAQLSKPKVSATLQWTRELIELRGWSYEVWSEPPDATLANVRFLAGFRRSFLFDRGLLDELQGIDMEDVALGTVFRRLPHWPESLVRAAIFHLLWTQRVAFEVACPLSSSTLLRRGLAR